jgi:cobalt-zinc-cadmium efflux system outer membrane protein
VGTPQTAIHSVSGDLETVFEVPALDELSSRLSSNPAFAVATADVAAREALVALAQAERVPDIKVEALFRRIEADRQNTFDVGFSIPLPVFDRGQARLRAARAELAAADARSWATLLELDQRLHDAYLTLTAALARAKAFKQDVLPRAATVLKAAEARFAAGDASLADVLPVRREWALAHVGHLESLRDVMQAWTELTVLVAVK